MRKGKKINVNKQKKENYLRESNMSENAPV